VIAGSGLGLLFLRSGERRPRIAVVHGLVGAAGLAMLLLALQGPRRGDAMGVGSFGTVAAVLFGIGIVFGLLGNRLKGLPLAVHATLAITAYTFFLAWVSLGGAAR
jgi:hypothetical protein